MVSSTRGNGPPITKKNTMKKLTTMGCYWLLKDIVSDLDSEIESGDHTQESIVDMADKALQAEGYTPEEITTKMGAQAEALVEAAFLSYGLDYPPHRVSRDALIEQQTQKPWRLAG
jgi:hypothetical protein